MNLNTFADKLSTIRESLPVQKKIVMYKTTQITPKKGDIIVRPISVYTNGEWDDGWKNKMFKKTSEGSYILKATCKLKTSPGLSADVANKEGFVCFSNKKPEPNWIYFKITGMAKSGKVLFVEPVYGDVSKLISVYNNNK